MASADEDADLAFIVVDLKGKMDGKNDHSYTAPTATGYTLNVTATNGSSIDKLENGKSYTLSVVATTAQTGKTVTLTGAVFEDGKTVAKSAQALGTTATTYTVIITDAANFNVTIA